MANARRLVAAPPSVPSQYGLLSSLGDQLRADPNPHWRNGTYIRSLCGGVDTTYDPCAITGGIPVPPQKTDTSQIRYFGARPFTVVTEFECSAPGAWDDLDEDARQYIERAEQHAVEFAFYTGIVAGVGGVAVPHLVSNVELTEDQHILQLAATTVVAATGVPATWALGALEDGLADCYAGGVGYIHTSPLGLAPLANAGLVKVDGSRIRTVKGNIVVVGDGYEDISPSGTTTTGVAWLYATGAMYAYRGDVRTFPKSSTLSRGVNTVAAIAERTYLVGYECCLLAAAIDLSKT